MQKLPECEHCQFHARSQFLVCAIHPQGVATASCLDYRRDPNTLEDLDCPRCQWKDDSV